MAIQTKRLAGLARITVDGIAQMLAGELTYSMNVTTRETLMGQDKVHGFKEMPHAGFISASIRDSAGLSVADFNAMSNVTVVCEVANGKTVVGRGMWTVDAQEVDSQEGKFTVKWEGVSVEEA